MIINHNLPAMNTNRQLGINNGNVSKSLEKLSSGLRINRAGDDAAGLAISEKMRAQIRGLDMATKNAQDGVSLIQTAEGNLQSIENILQRMSELAVESSNDTQVNKNDREAIQLEIGALSEEINRIAKQSEFNTQTLLDGTFTGKFFHIGANTGQNISVTIGAMNTSALKLFDTSTKYSIETKAVKSYSAKLFTSSGGGFFSFDASKLTSPATAVSSKVSVNLASAAGANKISILGSTHVFTTSAKTTMSVATAGTYSAKLYTSTDGNFFSFDATKLQTAATAVSSKVQVGLASATGAAQISILGSANVKYTTQAIGTVVGSTTKVTTNPVSLSTQTKANKAISTINNAINNVSMERAKLGAIQNRLEYSIENLEVSSENTAAAESRIRDVNMSKEMMNFTKNNILSQAATAMLAQANQTPQSVLTLLR